MPANKLIQLAKYGYLIISALMCILGVIIIANPTFPISLLCQMGGWILGLFGLVKLVGYCSRDLYRLAFQYDLASGILLIALGVIVLLQSGRIVHVICVILGLCILADALLKVQIAIDSRAFGIGRWYWILIAAVVTGLIGFLLVFRASASARIAVLLLGMSLVTEGVLNCITILIAVKVIRKNPL